MKKKLLVTALAALMVAPVAARAQEREQSPRISVVGEGSSTAKPDMAIVQLAVMQEAATAREALTANTVSMTKVVAAMKASGIADRDIQTTGIQINPRYSYTNKPDGSQDAKLVAYQVTNGVTLRVRDLGKVGDIIDQSVTLGVNQGGSITFTNDNPASTVTEARKKAVADAVAKAKTLTEAAGVGLGKILEMSETSYAQPPMPIAAKMYARAADGAGPPPVEAGENEYRVQVNTTFELK